MYKENIFNALIATAATIFTWCFGSWTISLAILFSCMVLDYMTGVIAGYKENNISSKVGFAGLKKKFTIIIILILAVLLDRLMGQGWVFRTLVIYFYVGMEGISILENAARLGLDIPDPLKEALIQIKNNGNDKDKINCNKME